jgi:exopolysaccharide biosynthesis polyprenyl glycosylphosphotransferase
MQKGGEVAKLLRSDSMNTMSLTNKREPFILLLGDILVFSVAIWLMLAIRTFSIPTRADLYAHFVPFSLLFVVWVAVYFIVGLYEKHTLILKSRIGSMLLNAQITNSLIAVLFFYLIPYFGITPKTNLFIYLVVSFGLVAWWRILIYGGRKVVKREKAILIGTGNEMRELEREVNNNSRYGLQFVSSVDIDAIESIDFKNEIVNRIYEEDISIIAADFKNEKVEPLLPYLYNLIFSQVKFVDMHKVYEDIFDRIPLSLVKYSWFLEHISISAQKGYDLVKRAMDVIMALLLGIPAIVVLPIVYLLIKIEDGGPIFFVQERVGRNNRAIRVVKFRSMGVHGEADGISKTPAPTKVGEFIRKTRIDELPQLWNVIKGDLSMIGPRPEIPTLVRLYEKEIPYYNVRHLITPGLSGWAQLYHVTPPKFNPGVDETKTKLSYDLYYIKNRSLILDLKVALRTLKVILSREGL